MPLLRGGLTTAETRIEYWHPCDLMNSLPMTRFLLLALAPLLTLGCSRSHDHAHTDAKSADGGAHGHEAHSHGHAHTAPHGGLLVEVGDHLFNVELVLDREAGRVAAYILDGHAENFVRIAQPAIELRLREPARGLMLQAVANPATGETVGNTSQFEATAPWLKESGSLVGEIARLEIRGATFSGLSFSVKASTP